MTPVVVDAEALEALQIEALVGAVARLFAERRSGAERRAVARDTSADRRLSRAEARELWDRR